MKIRKSLIIKLVFLILFFFKTVDAVEKKEVTLMSFNVENLFDITHDPGKNDYLFLPKKLKVGTVFSDCVKYNQGKEECGKIDWDHVKYKEKLNRVSETISRSFDGSGPDIIVLQEIENIAVLKELNKKFLSGRYPYEILREGQDPRGIDVAVLSRLPVKEVRCYDIDIAEKKEPRPILRCDISLPDGSVLVLLGFHFPSQDGDVSLRAAGLKKLSEIKASVPDGIPVIAAGDSNITSDETYLFDNEEIKKNWIVSHEIGMEGQPGTYYFKHKWSFLDIFLFSKNMNTAGQAWNVDSKSITVFNEFEKQYILKKKIKIPKWYRYPDYDGVSDHFPVIVRIHKK